MCQKWLYTEPTAKGLTPRAEALGAIGPGAKAALPELRRLREHRDLRVSIAAKLAIDTIETGI